MKRFALILVALCVFILPVNAGYWTDSLNQGVDVNGNNWTADSTGEWGLAAWRAGDGDTGTLWYNYNQPNAHITYLNPLGYYYTKVRIYGTTGTLWDCNGVTFTSIDGWTNLSLSGAGPISCTNETALYAQIREISLELGNTPPAPIANFTGAPLDAAAPAYVAFTDLSENEYGTCTYNWSFDPTDGVLAAPQDMDNEDITMLFTQNGNFTISHGVSCDGGSNTSTKTDYVHIYNATALSTFRVRAVDAISGYGVNGAQVDVLDVENASWTNQTSVTGEVTVTALTGHTINAYGSATGYDDGESLGLPVVHGSLYPIYMWPTTFGTNVSEGNVTVYVTVLEYGTNTRLPGYAVSLTGPSSGGADFTMGVTNENGIFQTVVKNQTDYNVKVLAQKGHLGANKNFNSGTQSGGDAYVEVTLWLGINSITTAPTQTTLPGGGTPVPTVTYLAHCDPSASDYDEALCRSSKGGVGLNILADYMDDLILLCIFVTIMYLLGFKLGS